MEGNNRIDKNLVEIENGLNELVATMWGQEDITAGMQLAEKIEELCSSIRCVYPDTATDYFQEAFEYREWVVNKQNEENGYD